MTAQILAHRTAMGLAPPNSFEGFLKCAELQIGGLECDISFTKDGRAVVWTETTAGLFSPQTLKNPGYFEKTKLIRDINLEELKRYRRRDSLEKVMDLENLWEMISVWPLKVFFDIKLPNAARFEHLSDLSAHFIEMPVKIRALVEKEIIRPAQDRKLSHKIGLVSFMGGADLLRMAKEKEPAVSTSLIIILPWLGRFPWNGLEKTLPFLDSVIIGWKTFNQWTIPPWSWTQNRIMTVAVKAGKKMEGGIADTAEEVDWALKNNFQAIWTNHPLSIKIFLSRRERWTKPN